MQQWLKKNQYVLSEVRVRNLAMVDMGLVKNKPLLAVPAVAKKTINAVYVMSVVRHLVIVETGWLKIKRC
ncbi:hypothetical protein [Dickeya ananatis]